MSFPRDAILGTGFAAQGRASPISPDAKPLFNRRESPPIRIMGDMIRAKVPDLWPKILANCRAQGTENMLREPADQWDKWPVRDLIAVTFNWSESPEGHDFWLGVSDNA